MSNRRKPTSDSWLGVANRVGKLVTVSPNGIVVVVIDRDTVIVDKSFNNTATTEHHGTGNISTLDAYGY